MQMEEANEADLDAMRCRFDSIDVDSETRRRDETISFGSNGAVANGTERETSGAERRADHCAMQACQQNCCKHRSNQASERASDGAHECSAVPWRTEIAATTKRADRANGT